MSPNELPIAIAEQSGPVEWDRHSVSPSPQHQLEEVWQNVGPELARLACALGVARDRVEDVLQEVYLAAWRKLPRGVDRTGLRRWLFRVTVNRCNLEHRQNSRWRSALKALTGWAMGSPAVYEEDHVAGQNEERELIRRALDTMQPDHRTVLVLRYFSGMDSREIGRVLGIPDSSVRSRLRVGRQCLARVLRQMGYTDERR